MFKTLLGFFFFKIEIQGVLYWYNFTDGEKKSEKINYVPTVTQQMSRVMLTILQLLPASQGY